MILLDLKMAKVDGFEVLHEVKNDPQLSKIPIIVLTSSERDEDINRAYELGANNYVSKPVDVHRFIDIVLEIEEYWLTISKIPR